MFIKQIFKCFVYKYHYNHNNTKVNSYIIYGVFTMQPIYRYLISNRSIYVNNIHVQCTLYIIVAICEHINMNLIVQIEILNKQLILYRKFLLAVFNIISVYIYDINTYTY